MIIRLRWDHKCSQCAFKRFTLGKCLKCYEDYYEQVKFRISRSYPNIPCACRGDDVGKKLEKAFFEPYKNSFTFNTGVLMYEVELPNQKTTVACATCHRLYQDEEFESNDEDFFDIDEEEKQELLSLGYAFKKDQKNRTYVDTSKAKKTGAIFPPSKTYTLNEIITLAKPQLELKRMREYSARLYG